MMPTAQILHGDCHELLKRLPDNSVDMVLLDPPHDEWASAASVFDQVPRLCQTGFVVCFCRVLDIPHLLEIARFKRFPLFDSYVWHDPQPSFVHTSRALKTHEHILVFKCGKPKLPFLKIGQRNKDTTPIHKGKSSLGKWSGGKRMYAPSEFKHLTSVLTFPRPLNGLLGRWQKPCELIRLMVTAYCPRGGTILDPFAGSGTTAQVAEEEGRESVLIEINPKYASAIAERMSRVQPRFNLV
jgi:hypothetical protein